jgi:hypothetical protein
LLPTTDASVSSGCSGAMKAALGLRVDFFAADFFVAVLGAAFTAAFFAGAFFAAVFFVAAFLEAFAIMFRI